MCSLFWPGDTLRSNKWEGNEIIININEAKHSRYYSNGHNAKQKYTLSTTKDVKKIINEQRKWHDHH